MENYSTLSTAEYIDIVSEKYEDYLESWNTPYNSLKISHEQESGTLDIDFNDTDLPF